jgi:hypothetical protein
VITLLSILLQWIRTSKELPSPLRLLGMALGCAGMTLHLESGVVRGAASAPRLAVKERSRNHIVHISTSPLPMRFLDIRSRGASVSSGKVSFSC